VAADGSFSAKKLGDQLTYTEGHLGSAGCDRWQWFFDNLEKNGLVTELYR
jgi:hypothetical protein